MAEKKGENCISPAAADALIAAHDGDVALLALYLARHPGADDEQAAAVLCRTRAAIADAREKLGRLLEFPIVEIFECRCIFAVHVGTVQERVEFGRASR